MNQCIFVGRITKDLALETVGANNTAKCNFTVVTEHTTKGADGKYANVPDYHYLTVWGSRAEYLAKYACKGTVVEVRCEHQTPAYEKDGKKLTASNFVVNEVKIWTGGKTSSQDAAAPEIPDIAEVTEDIAEDVASTDIGADDLPF